MTKYFISAGWPYLYDIPGLHNCVPMLFADVYARFHRLVGDEVFFLCGGDEHGSRVEFVARGLKKDPQALVDEKHAASLPLLNALGISLDEFGRTSAPRHNAFVRQYLTKLYEGDRLVMQGTDVPYCPRCAKHLPDRFLQGRCPHCGDLSYGGQCNNKKSCGRIIANLGDGQCALCGGQVESRLRRHLAFPISQYRSAVLPHVASDRQNRAEVVRRVEETFRDVPAVVMTRDTPWGIVSPVEEDPQRTVYSWVDALLAKITFSPKALWKDPHTHKLFFLGMDGVPFYGVLLPALLLASEEGFHPSHWTILPNEVLIYEGGVCSKSTGTGIWLNEALAVLEGDLWRFHIYHTYARSEKHADFRWENFADAVNRILVRGLAANVERAASEPSAGVPDRARLQSIRQRFFEYDTAGAFDSSIATALDACVSRATLVEVLPLLSCFVPRIAERARQRLLGAAGPLWDGPLSHQDLRARYQRLVDERMEQQTLEEEVTNLRADSLCVCPINLQEQ